MNLKLVAAACAASLVSFGAQAAIIVSGNTLNFGDGSGTWSWDGTQHEELRGALEDATNFGPGGVVGPETVETVDLPDITPATLAGIDIFFGAWWREDQSEPYESTLVDWFLNGGNLILAQDATNRDGISSLLGFETIGGTSNPNTVTGALGSGPFGSVGPVDQAGTVGHFDNGVITGLGGTIFATNADGQATIVGFDAGVLGLNAGVLLAFADVDLISGLFGGADFGAGINDKGRLALNSFAWVIENAGEYGGPVVPVPAAAPLFLSALGGLAFFRRRRNAKQAD